MLFGVRALLRASCIVSVFAFCACGSSSNAPIESTLYGSCADLDAGTTCADAGGFQAAVVPILAKSCLKGCHDGSPDAAWPLTDYDDVQAWTTFISSDLARCTMPPPQNIADYPMTRTDRETILNWIVCGSPP
jgi:hypothetical protein